MMNDVTLFAYVCLVLGLVSHINLRRVSEALQTVNTRVMLLHFSAQTVGPSQPVKEGTAVFTAPAHGSINSQASLV